MKIVAISDTHSLHRKVTLPDGDVLIHAGDFMNTGKQYREVADFADWFMSQPHEYKILVAGNHDILMEDHLGACLAEFSKYGAFFYLQDSGVTINGFNFWGSPYQPEFCNWAFNSQRGSDIKFHWNKIPNDIDVLITHGPPEGILDQMNTNSTGHIGLHLGCADLREAVNRVQPRLHIFGHIHGSHGVEVLGTTGFHNVAICNEQYKAVNKPHVIDIE